MALNKSAEDYLETILILSKRLPVVRSVDIAAEMNFKKPSVSVAMKHLRENGYITVSDAGFITLTKQGQAVADRIYERHTFLTNWLTALGIDEGTAGQPLTPAVWSMSSAPKALQQSKNTWRTPG